MKYKLIIAISLFLIMILDVTAMSPVIAAIHKETTKNIYQEELIVDGQQDVTREQSILALTNNCDHAQVPTGQSSKFLDQVLSNECLSPIISDQRSKSTEFFICLTDNYSMPILGLLILWGLAQYIKYCFY